MSSTKPSAGDLTSIDEIHSDILVGVLGRLDGPSLASAICATSHLRSISSTPELWRRLCLATWPSLRHPLLPLLDASPRQFFADAYPFPTPDADTAVADTTDELPDRLISAVDLYHRGSPIFSCSVETNTSTDWFRGSPFRIDVPTDASVRPEELTLSWILIDPVKGRAVNVSSRRMVAAKRRAWCTTEMTARFATVAKGCALSAVVAWRKGTGDVMEVGLTVEDMDGVCLSGSEGLRVVRAAMEAGRKGTGKGEEEVEAKDKYLEYLRRKMCREESRARRERSADMHCAAVSVAVVLAFVFLLIFRRDDPWFSKLGRCCIHMTWCDRGAISLHGLGLQVVNRVDDADFILAHGTEALGLPSGDAQPMTIEDLEQILELCSRRRIPMVVANPDFVTVEVRALRVMPGTLADKYEKLGGEVKWMGKPDEIIYKSAMAMADLAPYECIAVGDSLHHDIKGANIAGIESVLITGGIHAAELGLAELGESASPEALQTLASKYNAQPSYVLPSFSW